MLANSILFGLILTISFGFLCFASENKCPPKEDISPCLCESPWDPTIRCINLTRMETIKEIFQRTGDLRFRFFSLENSTLMFLPASSLVSKRFYGLMILNTRLIGMFDSVPSSSNTIGLFSLQNVVIQKGIIWRHFEKLGKLVNLQFIRTHVKTLGKEFAKYVNPKLTHLSLMDTKTTKLEEGVFAGLSSIYDITITKNKIKTLQRSMFGKPCNIRSLSLADNLIEAFPDDMFTDMPYLKSLGLQKNRLTILKEAVLSPVYNQMTVINVDKNPIVCDCKIEWLTKRPSGKVLGFCGDRSPVRKGVHIKDLTENDFKYCHD